MKLAALLLLVAPLTAASIQFDLQVSGSTESLRGVGAVDAQVCWASGTHGTFLRTSDGGAHWIVGKVAGAEALDFRDVEAIDADTAYLLSIGAGTQSRVYKTIDAGRHWKLQFTNPDPTGFFDGFAFWSQREGILFGDPVDGRFAIAVTHDGETWTRLHPKMPLALPNEGAFAASGTSIAVRGSRDVWFATGGGAQARVFLSHDAGQSFTAIDTPLRHDAQMSGVFGMAVDGARVVLIGGNDKEPDAVVGNAAVWQGHWTTPQTPPSGARSAVAAIRGLLVTVGRNGADISEDHGITWSNVSHAGYHAISFAKGKGTGWAVGADGHIARVTVTGALRNQASRP